MSSAAFAALVIAAIGIQTFWISRAIGKVEDRVDSLDNRVETFRSENHRDMQAHTEVITDLRERVTRLERDDGR